MAVIAPVCYFAGKTIPWDVIFIAGGITLAIWLILIPVSRWYVRAFPLLCIVFATSCADSRFPPSLSDELRGEWVRTDDETRHYIFDDEYATTWIYNFSTVVAPKWYSTEETGDRVLTLTEINTGNVQRWKFSETDGETITLTDITTQPAKYYNLKRK